ncbi:MAG: lytic transglycosylase domain-containing protein [Deltaproteobacteria bacterium]|nr:lytic transglycosylase domain-containing protein [Deltaproteobacteria bacterium]
MLSFVVMSGRHGNGGWRYLGLALLLGLILVPLLVATRRGGSEQAAVTRPPSTPLWRRAAEARRIEGASTRPPPSAASGRPSVTPPGLQASIDEPELGPAPELGADFFAALEVERPTERVGREYLLANERDEAAFLDRVPSSASQPESAFGKLASKIVGNSHPAVLGRSKKMQAANLYLAAGRYEEAWNILSTERPRLLGSDGAIEAAMAAISAGRAADGLAWLGDDPPDDSDRAAYWWARLAQAAGRHDEARPILEELAEDETIGYYGVWARARLRDSGPIGSPVVLDGRATRDSSDIPPRAVALAELSGLVRRHGASVPELGRAETFARAGSFVAAVMELRQAYKLRPGTFDRADGAALARIARMLGDEELALRLEPPDDPRQYHRHAWRELVVAAGNRHGVDPDLIWAVMLRESRFHPNAASPAGAAGLMQLMPATGRAIARVLRVANFRTSALLDPDCAIDFGAFLLSALLRRYDGNVPVSLAAYNAGIGPVDQWLAGWRRVDADVFAERIPYPETNRYVRRVLTSLAVYQEPLTPPASGS